MYLQLNTKFNPFTYDEMVRPLLYYKQAYDAADAAYSNLAAQTEAWKNAANREQSPEAYNTFQRYSMELRNAINDFSNGMTSGTRSALLGLKRRYASDIQPIADASKKRDALAEEQRKMIAANPTMLYQRMAKDMSLDDFIKNPSLDYGQQYSGALLTQQVTNAAANLAKEANESISGKRKLKSLLPFQYEVLQKSGFDRDEVMKAILNAPNADKILTGLVESAISTSGVKNWGDENTIARAYDYARQGLYNAIGASQYQIVTDQYGMQSALEAQKAARERAARAAAAQAQGLPPGGKGFTGLDPGDDYIRLKSESRGASADKKSLWKAKGYFNRDNLSTVKGRRRIYDESILKDLLYQRNHAKTKQERAKFDTAYRNKRFEMNHGGQSITTLLKAYAATPYTQEKASRSLKGYNDWSNNEQNKDQIRNNLLAEWKATASGDDFSLYTFARGAGMSRHAIKDINRKEFAGVNLVNDKYQQGYSNKGIRVPVFSQMVDTKEASDAIINRLYNRVGGGSGKAEGKIYQLSETMNASGKMVGNLSKGLKVSDLYNPDSSYRVTQIQFVPQEPGRIILKLNDGKKYLVEGRALMSETAYKEFVNAIHDYNTKPYAVDRADRLQTAHQILAGSLTAQTVGGEVEYAPENGLPFNTESDYPIGR